MTLPNLRLHRGVPREVNRTSSCRYIPVSPVRSFEKIENRQTTIILLRRSGRTCNTAIQAGKQADRETNRPSPHERREGTISGPDNFSQYYLMNQFFGFRLLFGWSPLSSLDGGTLARSVNLGNEFYWLEIISFHCGRILPGL